MKAAQIAARAKLALTAGNDAGAEAEANAEAADEDDNQADGNWEGGKIALPSPGRGRKWGSMTRRARPATWADRTANLCGARARQVGLDGSATGPRRSLRRHDQRVPPPYGAGPDPIRRAGAAGARDESEDVRTRAPRRGGGASGEIRGAATENPPPQAGVEARRDEAPRAGDFSARTGRASESSRRRSF